MASEACPVLDPRGVEPNLERAGGAVNGSAKRDADLAPHAILVSLRPPDGQNDPLPDALEVTEVDCSEFGALRPPANPISSKARSRRSLSRFPMDDSLSFYFTNWRTIISNGDLIFGMSIWSTPREPSVVEN